MARTQFMDLLAGAEPAAIATPRAAASHVRAGDFLTKVNDTQSLVRYSLAPLTGETSWGGPAAPPAEQDRAYKTLESVAL